MSASIDAKPSMTSHDDDIQRLRRLTRDANERAHALTKRIDALERADAERARARRGTRVTRESVVECAFVNDFDSDRGVVKGKEMKSEVKRGIRATHELRVTFEDESALSARCASTRADYIDNADAYESRTVTLDKVKWMKRFGRKGRGVRVNAVCVPFGAEGVDAVPNEGTNRRGHQLTGFGAGGGDLIARCHTDSMGAIGVEFNDNFAMNVGVFAGNRQAEDGKGKVLARIGAKKATATTHASAALHASRSQDGETLVGGAVTVAKTLPKSTRAFMANAWGSMAATRGGKSREDFTEWGLAATLPPTSGAGAVKNCGFGVVLGKPANRDGVQAEAFLRVGGDGEEPGTTVVPGVVLSVDERGRRDTVFGCRVHWVW